MTPVPRPRAAILALPLLAALACEQSAGPRSDFPANATPYPAPGVYAAWWRVAEQCSGQRADMGRVSWYSVPGLITGGVEPANGAFFRDGSRIALASGSLRDGPVVRHEMLHAILSLASAGQVSGHPREMFFERCGGIVTCNGGCAREAGIDAYPGPPAATVEPAELALSLALDRPSAAASDTGWLAVIVAARNPRATVVAVNVPASPLGFGPLFGADVEGLAHASIRLVEFPPLRPGETRRWVFEWPVGGLAPGAHRVRGAFVSDSTAPETFTVLP